MGLRKLPLTIVVLAAGRGKRMRSKRIKLLHMVAGRPMLAHVLEAARSLRPSRLITVVGHQETSVREAVADLCDTFVLQKEQRGTAHAVLQALPRFSRAAGATLMILNGDMPTLRTSTLRTVLARHRRLAPALTLVTGELDHPSGYGRVVRDADGRVLRIVEERDASPAERRIHEVNCGIYCARSSSLIPVLRSLRPDNAQGEYYLTDAVRRLIEAGERVVAVRHADAEEVLGVNSRAELARAARTLYRRKAEALETAGVTLLDASRTWVDPRARIGRDTVLYPDVIIEGPSVLGEDCVVLPGSRITDSHIGRGVRIKDHTVVWEARIGNGAEVGPFARLRPGSILEAEVRLGNFVEVKKSRLGRGVKASHLSYLGDTTVGAGSNIGAGTITCNYDGEKKHPTIVGKHVFIGSDTQLVAPVTVGDGAYVGAGTTVIEDVPPGALAVSRVPQKNIEGWAEKRKRRRKKGHRGRRGTTGS